MSTDTAFGVAWELRRQLTDAGVDDTVALVIFDAVKNKGEREEDLRSAAATIQRRLDDTMRSLDAGYHVNSLGELQSAAPAFDIACARRQDAVMSVKVAASLLGDDENAVNLVWQAAFGVDRNSDAGRWV